MNKLKKTLTAFCLGTILLGKTCLGIKKEDPDKYKRLLDSIAYQDTYLTRRKKTICMIPTHIKRFFRTCAKYARPSDVVIASLPPMLLSPTIFLPALAKLLTGEELTEDECKACAVCTLGYTMWGFKKFYDIFTINRDEQVSMKAKMLLSQTNKLLALLEKQKKLPGEAKGLLEGAKESLYVINNLVYSPERLYNLGGVIETREQRLTSAKKLLKKALGKLSGQVKKQSMEKQVDSFKLLLEGDS